MIEMEKKGTGKREKIMWNGIKWKRRLEKKNKGSECKRKVMKAKEKRRDRTMRREG